MIIVVIIQTGWKDHVRCIQWRYDPRTPRQDCRACVAVVGSSYSREGSRYVPMGCCFDSTAAAEYDNIISSSRLTDTTTKEEDEEEER